MSKFPGYLKIHKDKKMRYLKLSGFEMNIFYETLNNTRRGFSTGELRDVGKLLDYVESLGVSTEGVYSFPSEDYVVEVTNVQLKLVNEVMKEMQWAGKHARKVLTFLEKLDNASTDDPRVIDARPENHTPDVEHRQG